MKEKNRRLVVVSLISVILVVGVAIAGLLLLTDSGEDSSDVSVSDKTGQCAEIYAPVCGTDGITYNNSCEAGLANVAVAYNGTCSDKTGSNICPEIYAPVCGTDGTTYNNSCELDNAGATAACSGECPCDSTGGGTQPDTEAPLAPASGEFDVNDTVTFQVVAYPTSTDQNAVSINLTNSNVEFSNFVPASFSYQFINTCANGQNVSNDGTEFCIDIAKTGAFTTEEVLGTIDVTFLTEGEAVIATTEDFGYSNGSEFTAVSKNMVYQVGETGGGTDGSNGGTNDAAILRPSTGTYEREETFTLDLLARPAIDNANAYAVRLETSNFTFTGFTPESSSLTIQCDGYTDFFDSTTICLDYAKSNATLTDGEKIGTITARANNVLGFAVVRTQDGHGYSNGSDFQTEDKTYTYVINEGDTGGGVVDPICQPIDVNDDGRLTLPDFTEFAAQYRKNCQNGIISPSDLGLYGQCGPMDVSLDGTINIFDLSGFARYYQQASCAALAN